MKKLRFLIYFISIVIVSFYAVSRFSINQPPVNQIENLIGKTIPVNVTNLQSVFNGGIQGNSFFIQFDLPSESFSNFVEELCNTDQIPLSSDYNAFAQPRLSTWPDWWLANPTQITISGKCSPKRGVDLEIFVDETDPHVYRIYMAGGSA